MRLLVCGSRDWNDLKFMEIVMAGFRAQYKTLTVIEGGAPGADLFAEEIARRNGDNWKRFPADWDKHGKKAGPIRNQQMLDEGRPVAVAAFKDGFNAKPGFGGTEDMVRRSNVAGLPTFVFSHGDGT